MSTWYSSYCVLGDAALMAKAEDDWAAQHLKDWDEEVSSNDGEEPGGDEEDEPNDHHEEQTSKWDMFYKHFIT